MQDRSSDFGQIVSEEKIGVSPEQEDNPFLDEPLSEEIYRACKGKQRHVLYCHVMEMIHHVGVDTTKYAPLKPETQYSWRELEDKFREIAEDVFEKNEYAVEILEAAEFAGLVMQADNPPYKPRLLLRRCPLCWRIIANFEGHRKTRRLCSWHESHGKAGSSSSNEYKTAKRVMSQPAEYSKGKTRVQEIQRELFALAGPKMRALLCKYRSPLYITLGGRGLYHFVPLLYGRPPMLDWHEWGFDFKEALRELRTYAAERGFDGSDVREFVRIINQTEDNEDWERYAEKVGWDGNRTSWGQDVDFLQKELYDVYASHLYLFWPELSFAEAWLRVKKERKPGRPLIKV